LASTPIQTSGRAARRSHPRRVELEVPGQLHFERARLRVAAGACRHDLGWLRAECEGRQQGLRRRHPCKRPHRPAGTLGFQLPQRAVERIARAARREEPLQSAAVDAPLDHTVLSRDRRRHAIDPVIEIKHPRGLAAAAVPAVVQRDDDGVLMLEHEAGDTERRRELELLHGHRESQCGHRQRLLRLLQ
jgi:hypothetical protein